ncbi:hypothetical protein, partial [Herbaspirillum sp. B65]|uniref:hypothetical protein n=1 Tax=Herbaspirillum sp. B65 TaxID=137708 RepID=UPI0005C8A65A
MTKTGSVTVKNLEATTNAKWQYRIDGGTWQDQTSNGKISVSNAANADRNGAVKTVEVREIDKAGNEGAIASLSFTLDTTAPVAPTLELDQVSVAASGNTPALTRTGSVTVKNLEATTNAKWQYRIDGGTWQDQTSNGKISVSNAANADKNGAVKTVEVREIDKAGNEGAIASLSFTLDTTAPVAPTLELDQVSVAASGNTPALTRTGSVTVKNLEATTNAKWKYRIDGGTWQDQTTNGKISVSNAANANKNGALKTVEVREIDKAGNEGAIASLSFTLDTIGPVAPTLELDQVS